MMDESDQFKQDGEDKVKAWRDDWCLFAREALKVNLDPEQEAILNSVQHNARTSVASGTARGKDFVAAVAAICFMYLTPTFNESGELVGNTKVALTAPTGRQVSNIMQPEFSRIFLRAKRNGVNLPGRLVADDIRTEHEDWFLTAFKADENQHENWSGFHAVNTMFVITEASGIADGTFDAIEGNLQGNSRILLVFNPNSTVGYAAKSQKGDRWTKFRLSSLTAPNIVQKKIVIPGQVDYEWILDKLDNWCMKIDAADVREEEDDFEFEGQWYRPEDVFRIKVLGKFPKVGEDSLIPDQWIDAAQQRWYEFHKNVKDVELEPLRLGVDVAGMGRDSTVYVHRHGNYVKKIVKTNSGGRADHMATAGKIVLAMKKDIRFMAFVDTIGEGAGVYSRTNELGYGDRVFSCKYSESAKDSAGKHLTDVTGQYKFSNMRAYLHWAVRDWLNPKNGFDAMIPSGHWGESFRQEATEIKWRFMSNGAIQIEEKDEIKKRLGRSPDEFDALANTFYPFASKKSVNLTQVINAFRRR